MRRYPLYIFDLDGTLYRGNEALPGAVETVRRLQEEGALLRYLTNNSSRTAEQQREKLAGMGFPVELSQVLTSSIGTARFAADAGVRTAFAIGEKGLHMALAEAGIQIVQEKADAVIAGIKWSFNYDDINGAMQVIRGGARFIATNTDATYPLEGGRLTPGAGVIISAIETCTGVKPVVVGKPNQYLVDYLLKETGVAPSDALVVGDRYETDILSGQAAGCDTLLVLTGVSHEAPAGQLSAPDLSGLL